MSLLVTSSRDADSQGQKDSSVPPLFAAPLREDLISRLGSAISSGDHDKATGLLREADGAFPGDRVFLLLRLQYLKAGQRKAHFEAALQEATDELSEDRFVASLSKFREALLLSRGYEVFERKVYDVSLAAADQRIVSHWRFAETLLFEVTRGVGEPEVPNDRWEAIERQRRADSVRMTLDESGRAEHTEYLPHLRERLADLAKKYPDEEGVGSRLLVLDGLLARRFGDERDKNLRRLIRFRDRIDLSGNPQTLRQFGNLVTPFVNRYPDDPAFLTVLDELRDLQSNYENAARLLAENQLLEALQLCDRVLQQRPRNVLFAALEEKAKAREWVGRLVTSATQRAKAFEQRAQYAEALGEWESLREIDPHHPGVDSEILHCAALKQQADNVRTSLSAVVDAEALTPEVVEAEPAPTYDVPLALVTRLPSRTFRRRVRIAITADAWNHLKTGVAAAAAVLLVVLVFATSARR
jgi:hypothetical protein